MVKDSEALCAEITATHARTFVTASRFLPAEKRRAAFAVYAFCRVADDIVDDAGCTTTIVAAAALAAHREKFESIVGGVRFDNEPVFDELAWAMDRFDIPITPFNELFEALAADLAPVRYTKWNDLATYCGGVASTVGEMCAHIFGVQAGEAAQALHHARTLGIALQLTNILRDVGEDAARGRCYLPDDDLAVFDITRSEILERTIEATDSRWRALMQHEISRARSLYNASRPGLDMVDADARCCAKVCARGYAAILGAIEQRKYDSLTGRARVNGARKAAIMLGVWAGNLGRGSGVRASAVREQV